MIDKENAVGRQGIFMIDASKSFRKDGAKNRLRERDIHRIVDVFNEHRETPGYARMVPLVEIASETNDVVDGFTIFVGNDSENPRGGFAWSHDLAPEAKAAIRLPLPPKRCPEHGRTPGRVDVGTFSQHLLVEIPSRLHRPWRPATPGSTPSLEKTEQKKMSSMPAPWIRRDSTLAGIRGRSYGWMGRLGWTPTERPQKTRSARTQSRSARSSSGRAGHAPEPRRTAN